MTEVNFNRYLTRGSPTTVTDTKKSKNPKKKKSPKKRKKPKNREKKSQKRKNIGERKRKRTGGMNADGSDENNRSN